MSAAPINLADAPRVRLAESGDAPAVAEIYNQGIAERGATFETEPRAAEDMVRRIQDDARRFPLLVAEADGRILGWASIGRYRDRPCYAGVGEFSVYIHRDARGRGVGRTLLTLLVREARERGYWKLLSRVFPSNAASLGLCRALGFREVGTYEKHGRLDGRWLDVVIVEILIPENQP
jgi:phosphinothricin acetyltransferase